MAKMTDIFPYYTMKNGQILFHHMTFRDALNLAKSWVHNDWDSIVIVKEEPTGERVMGTVRMQNGKAHWLSKRYDVFNGRIAVPIKKGKKKSKPAPFGL